jgi:hypothetical protein
MSLELEGSPCIPLLNPYAPDISDSFSSFGSVYGMTASMGSAGYHLHKHVKEDFYTEI